jgi:hypothetical protein
MFDRAEAKHVFDSCYESLSDQSYQELLELCLDHKRSTEITGPSGKPYWLEVLAYWDDKPEGALRVFVTLTPDNPPMFSGSIDYDFIKPPQQQSDPESSIDRHELDWRWLPFFEFNSLDQGWAFVLDSSGHVNQEPPEFEEHGPDLVFDSRGRFAELGVEHFDVVIKRWSERPDLARFDKCLRTAAARYLVDEDVSPLRTFELRDRLETAVRRWHRQHTILWPIELFARRLWRWVSRRSV